MSAITNSEEATDNKLPKIDTMEESRLNITRILHKMIESNLK